MGPLPVEIAFDYHCSYSHRAMAWLCALEPDRVRLDARAFPLEQVRRDPAAAEWRIWEQPLDYEHHKGRRDRRSLAALLATLHLGTTRPPGVARRFRLAVYDERLLPGADISDPATLDRLAVDAGADFGEIRDLLADPTRQVAVREHLAADWAYLRREYATFGTPTIRLPGDAPFYLRLAEPVAADRREATLDALLAARRDLPGLLELKVPDRIE